MIGGFTSISRVLGLARDVLTAGFFGTSLPISAFFVAFRIPNLFRALFGEGALSSAFVPVLVATRRNEGEEKAWALVRRVISLVGVVLLGVVALGVVGITLFMNRPGLSEKAAMVLPLARIMLSYLFFICMAGLSMAILNSYHKFALPALTPSLLNITWITFLLAVCPRIGSTLEEQVYGLAWGIFAAGIIQLSVQIPALFRCGYRPGFHLGLNDPRVIRVFTLMGPAAIGVAVTQINVMVNSFLAIWVGSWAPAALFYAERLLYFPQGILAVALSTVLLPVLSSHAARSDFAQIRATINHSLRNLLFVMIPAAIGLLVLARPLVQMICEQFRFTPESTRLTALALQCYAPGLMVFCLAKVFVPVFYATQDTKTPVKIALIAVTLNFMLNILFILTLPLYTKHAGLALSTVISEGFNGITLAVLIHRRFGSPGWRQILASAARSLAAAVGMGIGAATVNGMLYRFGARLGLIPKLNEIQSVLISVACGVLIYAALARLFRCGELKEVLDALRKKRSRTDGRLAADHGG